MFHRILVATDGSATAERGVREAIALAAQQKAELAVLYVVNFYAAVAQMQMSSERLFERHLQSMRHAGHVALDRAATVAHAAGVTPRLLLRQERVDRAAEAIVAEARQGYDLVVLGTHGRRGWQRFVLGSDAEEVLRTATVPVLLVRAAEDAPA